MRWWWLLLIVACDGASHAKPSDASIDTFFAAYCDPVTQSGCGPGEKCTWITAPDRGEADTGIGCVPDGAVALGSSCTFSSGGYDNCVKGAYCGNNRCDAICSSPGAANCGSGAGCVADPWQVDELTNEGYCLPLCDPLADNDFDGPGSAFSASGSGCGSGDGCYGLPSAGERQQTAFTCGYNFNAATPHHHRDECTDGCAYFGVEAVSTSCAPGYEPMLRESTAISTVICVALCAPVDCYAGNCGSNDANRKGAAPHRCSTSDAVGSFGSGEECQYLWTRELDGSNRWWPSPYSNSVGFCVDRDLYGQPRCNTLPLAAAAAQGCVSTTTAGIQP